MGVTVIAVPLLATRLPGVMTPVPLAKTPVRIALCPAAIVALFATKLEMEAGGAVCEELEEPPQPVKFTKFRLRPVTHTARRSRFKIFLVTKKLLVFLPLTIRLH